MDTLLQKFQPGMQPHRYVIITIGSIAIQNGTIFHTTIREIINFSVWIRTVSIGRTQSNTANTVNGEN